MNHSSDYYLFDSFEDDEIKVAEILLELPQLIWESDLRFRFPFSWSSKGRRTAIHDTPSPPPPSPPPPPPPPPPTPLSPPSAPFLCPPPCNVERPILKVEVSSPATPLSFSPSESDAKSKHSKRKFSKKRTKEEWLGILAELSRCNEQLKGEVENAKLYYNKEKAFNMELKARGREPSLCLKKEEHDSDSSRRLDLVVEPTEPTISFNPKEDEEEEEEEQHQLPIVIHQPPSVIPQMECGSKILENSQYPYRQMASSLSSGVGLGVVLGIPDLNLCAEETVEMDYFPTFELNRVAIAAQARKRRRIEITRRKNNSMAAVKPRCR